MFPRATADLLRGCAVGATAGVLAIAAHGLGGGGTPSAAAATALGVLCALSGCVARRHGRRGWSTPVLLVVTQSAGHFLLSAVTDAPHVHHTAAPMLAAHAVAAAACGFLIVVGDRLTTGLSAIVAAVTHPFRPESRTPTTVLSSPADARLQRWFLGAISLRGPPHVCST